MDKKMLIELLKQISRDYKTSRTVAIGFNDEEGLTAVCDVLKEAGINYDQTGNALLIPGYVQALLSGHITFYNVPIYNDSARSIRELNEARKSKYRRE